MWPAFESTAKLIVLISVLAAIAAAFAYTAIVAVKSWNGVIIENFAVPKTVQDQGFSPDVMANRVADEIRDIVAGDIVVRLDHQAPASGTEPSGVAMVQSLTGLNLPILQLGTSAWSVAKWTQDVVAGHRVSGEVVEQEGQLVFRLRLNGQPMQMDTGISSAFDMATLVRKIAHAIAAGQFRHDPKRLFTLQGQLAMNVGDFELAAEYFDQAFEASGESQHLSYLALALASQGRYEEAIARYEEADRLGLRSAAHYNNWGLALANMNRYGRPSRNTSTR